MASFQSNAEIAVSGVLQNKLRTFLTTLGIIFGVSAVIAMLAIGNGAKKTLLEQMSWIGTNNITIESVEREDQENGSDEENQNGITNGQQKNDFSPGLNLYDLQAITNVLPHLDIASPQIEQDFTVLRGDTYRKVKTVAIENAFFKLHNIEFLQGKPFHPLHIENTEPVCIIGVDLLKRFYGQEKVIGSHIKCGDIWLKVVGVIGKKGKLNAELEKYGLINYNEALFIPINTYLRRFKDDQRLDEKDLASFRGRGLEQKQSSHQLNKIILRIGDSRFLESSAVFVTRLLNRRHNGQEDFKIDIPEMLLQQQQKTQETFNFVLSIIAGISLLVGGIGIMNIMLANVMERITEIGLRRSLGATKEDIISQFLIEAVLISLIGGLLGILLGVVAAKLISSYAGIYTVISNESIFISFMVATSIGILFGILPARKASEQDPIKALRSQ